MLDMNGDEMSSNYDESSKSVGTGFEEFQIQDMTGPEETNTVMTDAQLRYSMVEPGSVNPDLGRISLIDLAIIQTTLTYFYLQCRT